MYSDVVRPTVILVHECRSSISDSFVDFIFLQAYFRLPQWSDDTRLPTFPMRQQTVICLINKKRNVT